MSVNVNIPEKPQTSRVGRANQRYSENGARMVAGCICLNEERTKVIMISSSVHEGKWVIPKGGIELDEGDDYVISAIRETWEEAGVEGTITKKLPIVYDLRGKNAPILEPGKDFDPKKIVPKTEFHLYEMQVTQLSAEWPEKETRQRRWCSFAEAKRELEKANRLELIQALESSGIQKD